MIEVSIITPAYNCIDTIEETFKSVAAQSYKNWEWIIVDDCSTDDSFDLINKLAKGYENVIVLKTDNNVGSAGARNVGLKIAKGRYITFLDSDDLLDENYLDRQLEFIKDNGPLISSAYRRKAPKTCTDFYVPDFVDYKTVLKGNPLSCLTTMYDRNVIGDRYFPVEAKKCEDYVFWLGILRDGFVARGNHEVLATYVIHKGSKSSKKIRLIRHMFYAYHKTQGINWFKSWHYVFKWAIYGLKKYRNVR